MRIERKCEGCGAMVLLDLPEGFEDAFVVGVTCRACADRQVQEEGGVVLDLPPLPGALFGLGHVRVTGGAVGALADSNQHAAEFLARHARGDWGDNGTAGTIPVSEDEVRAGSLCTDEDDKANQLALLCGSGRILSGYSTNKGIQLWCLTDRAPRSA